MRSSTAPEEIESEESLREEAFRFARYISGARPGPEIVERYVDACRKLSLDRPVGEDRGLLGFVHGHPSALGPLDAVCGILRPQALLRKKLFVMLALLETSPAHAKLFIAGPRGWAGAACRLAFYGISVCLKLLTGLLIFPLARGAR